MAVGHDIGVVGASADVPGRAVVAQTDPQRPFLEVGMI